MKKYCIWLDDIRVTPYNNYYTFNNVNAVKSFIVQKGPADYVLDLDHDLGSYSKFGGDGIELIKWLLNNGYHENKDYRFSFNIHSQNVVGRENMQALINRYFKE